MSTAKRFLVISLTNIGDVILTAPLIDQILYYFPDMFVDVMLGPKAKTLFDANPRIRTFIYNKHTSIFEKWALIRVLRREEYQCVIDLRRTIFPFLVRSQQSQGRLPLGNQEGIHSVHRHLGNWQSLYPDYAIINSALAIIPKDPQLFLPKQYVCLAIGAADSAKRWPVEYFIDLAKSIKHKGYDVVWVGDQSDAQSINSFNKEDIVGYNYCGQLDLSQLAAVIKSSSVVIANDSAPMHMASYFNKPIIALWGPTDRLRYGPWSTRYQLISHNEQCPRCEDPQFPGRHECMKHINVDEVMKALSIWI